MIDNVNMAVANGYIEALPGTLLDLQALSTLPDDRQIIVLTGAQGEPLSVLSRVANNANRDIEVHDNDTVVISATAIPGNETVIASVVDNLTRRGARVLTRRTSPGVHVPGHGSQEELKLMLRLINPHYFVPVHGEYRMLAAHADLARQTSVAPENVFILEDGDVLELDDSGAGLVEPIQAGHVYVDGLRTWDVGEAVLRDRRMLSRDGFVVVVVSVDHATGRVYGEPEIVSSGFTVPGEAEELMERAAAVVVEALRAPNLDPLNEDHITDRVREALSRFLYKETRSRPMILTVPVEV